MPTVVSIAATRGYVPGAGTASVATTTDTAVASGSKAIAVLYYFGTATVSGFSGGGLTWTAHHSPLTTEFEKMVIASADAPSGLASGSTITATLSTGANQFALGLGLFACDGLGAVDGTPTFTHGGNASAWTQSITTANTGGVILGAAWVSFTPGGLAPASATTEVADWIDADSAETHLVYKATAAGVNTAGGTWSAAKPYASAAVAFAPSGGAAAATPPILVMAPRN